MPFGYCWLKYIWAFLDALTKLLGYYLILNIAYDAWLYYLRLKGMNKLISESYMVEY